MNYPSQKQTPIVEALKKSAINKNAPFYTPGHKKGQGISQILENFLGKSVFKADLPELPELDNLYAPTGIIQQAQQLASLAFGAEKTWFLVNGSTCGIIAAILATCNPGEKIILPRNIHISAISGLILSGAIPIFINPEYNQELDIVGSITPETLEKTLKNHPDTKAVMIVYPTYQGICGDIQAIANITHQYNIPLLVDEAHGGHFHFHPDLPKAALAADADLTIQSTHKVLGAITQASMLHLQGKRISPQRIDRAIQLVQSTSPNYLLLASLDAARQQMATQGQELLTHTLQLASDAREGISSIPQIDTIELDNLQLPKHKLDRTRLTINLNKLGIDGFLADEILHQQLGVTAELPLQQNLSFIISIGNTKTDIEKLIIALNTLAKEHYQTHSTIKSLSVSSPLKLPPSKISLSPREAYFAPSKNVSIAIAKGKISAETICPYPPGIPVLMLGETISTEAIDYLQQTLLKGGIITGCSDSTLQTLKIII